jgi:hypothetical protein
LFVSGGGVEVEDKVGAVADDDEGEAIKDGEAAVGAFELSKTMALGNSV